ncbi:MAG TPA: oligosaccharide flippase family protein [Burkholderiales bacterium]|nr:oligosaccharide flippase family protein [Burkholderiales bacterium]
MSAAITLQGLKRRALSLGMIKAFDQGMQFLLPVVLVRCLDAATFGEYRLLWLMVGTLIGVASLNMAGSLYYFLPRSDPEKKRLYIHHAWFYLAGVGLLCGLAVSPLNPLLPEAARELTKYGALVPAFIAVWFAALLLEYLPTIDERIGWQAWATITVSLVRVVLLAAGAWLTGDMRVILWLLVAAAVLKLGLLFFYMRRHHGLGRPWFERKAFAGQFRHSAPFGFSAALYGLRGQSDQWVAATLFSLHSFAAFSIAAILGQIVNLFRNSVLEAFLPSMSRLHAAGENAGMMDMNARANVLVAGLLYPLLGFVFVYAEDIVTVVYTAAYVDAAPVMRVYALGMTMLAVEVGSLLLLLRQGPYAIGVNALALALSVLASLAGALHFGLWGAAVGSILALGLDRTLTLRRIAVQAGIPLRRLQDWRGLARTALIAGMGSALAWGVTRVFFMHAPPLARLAAGAVILAVVYALFILRRSAK